MVAEWDDGSSSATSGGYANNVQEYSINDNNNTDTSCEIDVLETSLPTASVDLNLLESQDLRQIASSSEESSPHLFKLTDHAFLITRHLLQSTCSQFDVTICCSGRKVAAHKLVLASASSFLKKVFQSIPENVPCSVVLDGLSWEALEHILMYIYTGEVVVSGRLLSEIISAAEMLQIMGVEHLRTKLVSQLLPPDKTSQCSLDVPTFLSDKQSHMIHDCHPSDKNVDICSANTSEIVTVFDGVIEQVHEIKSEKMETNVSYPQSDDSNRRLSRHDSMQDLKNRSIKRKFDSLLELKTNVEKPSFGICKYKESNLLSSNTLDKPESKTQGSVDSTECCKLMSESTWGIKKHSSNCTNKLREISCVTRSVEHNSHSLKESLDEKNLQQKENKADQSVVDLKSEETDKGILVADAKVNSCINKNLASAWHYEKDSQIMSHLLNSNSNVAADYLHRLSLLGGVLHDQGAQNSTLLSSELINRLPPNMEASAPVRQTSQQHLQGSSYPLSLHHENTPLRPHEVKHRFATQEEIEAALDTYQRKLAFHEPRPCPSCRRMYRDAATLRTHINIMHTPGNEPFICSCGNPFRTKYEMYHHKKNGHYAT